MLLQVTALCVTAQKQLAFGKGLSDTEEPDLWCHSLDGNLEQWVDVSEPAPERIKKATRMAATEKVYCFNQQASTWWELNRDAFCALPASVFKLQWPQVQALASLMGRTPDASITLTDGSILVATEAGECEVSTCQLQ